MRGGESELSYLLLELACDTFVVNRCKLNMLQSTFNLCISVSFLLLGGLPAVADWAPFFFTWRATCGTCGNRPGWKKGFVSFYLAGYLRL
jgi:hypothetical protein